MGGSLKNLNNSKKKKNFLAFEMPKSKTKDQKFVVELI